jgi:PTS system mannose-specific IIA component
VTSSGSEKRERRHIGLLVVTHGGLAEELVAAVRKIVGQIESLGAVSIDWDDDAGEAAQRIEQGIRNVEREAGVLILTDMFGGTPTNLALSQHDGGEVEVITGVNLPMLIKYANLHGKPSLSEAALGIAEQGREAIQVASEVLERDSTECDE